MTGLMPDLEKRHFCISSSLKVYRDLWGGTDDPSGGETFARLQVAGSQEMTLFRLLDAKGLSYCNSWK